MFQFFGEYECRLDPKGRLKIPSALLGQNGEGEEASFYLNRGFEKCINIYPKKVWEERFEGLSKLNSYDADHRQFMRYMLRGIKFVQCDGVDRITLGKTLCDFANIRQDVIVMGMGDYIEVWDTDSFNQILSNKPQEFAALSQKVMGETGSI